MVEESEASGTRSCPPCYLHGRPKAEAYAYLVTVALFKPPELAIFKSYSGMVSDAYKYLSKMYSTSTSSCQQGIFCFITCFSYVSGYLQGESLNILSLNNV